jgi:Lipocalin-like domain
MRTMVKRLTVIGVLVFATWFDMGRAMAREASSIVGSWSLVSLKVYRSGTAVELLGPHASGRLMFGSDGRYALIGVRGDLPDFKAGNRSLGTAEENRAVVGGSLVDFGTFSLDRTEDTIVFRVEKSTLPNCDGSIQVKRITLDGDKLTSVTPGYLGHQGSTATWQRLK